MLHTRTFWRFFLSAYETTFPEIEKQKQNKKKTFSRSVVNRRDKKKLKKETKSSWKVFTVKK